ncbi:type VII secretion protein EccB [Salinispora sp. H7-4]|uniref:type VII secretion protein EccB n=1 Tax=Salinispora sp. H7-4 TaxID=2748321 RepID=UPI0015D2B89A|nr:type VII secretion protein EccB [Salinispora sp. H7-4]NYT95272.1 type VII secretion protein EccB [Salinispora sp. H7-4]
MSSRRDQVQSYQFFVQRMTSALVSREPDPENGAPFRRLGGAGFASIMVAVLCLAAVGVYGILRPGGATTWKTEGAVILEKETGTRYIYRDGHLHAVINYSSALLALGKAAGTVSVSRNSLLGTPRGAPIGIRDAPDALPDPKRLLAGPWTLCTQSVHDSAGADIATAVLTVGAAPGGGRELGEMALLVRDTTTDRLHLIWHDYRYEIQDESIVLEGLTMTTERQVEVGGAWLNALPAGEPIGIRNVVGRGEVSQTMPDARVGQILVVENQSGGRQYYLVERAQLRPLTQLEAEVLLADPETTRAYPNGAVPEPVSLSAGAAAAAPKAPPAAEGPHRAPGERPEILREVGDQPAVCAAYHPGRSEPTLLLEGQVQQAQEPVLTPEQSSTGIPLADRVVIEPGHGVLVEAMPAPDAATGALSLVTDLGYRYSLGSREVANMLGYGGVEPIALPASLVDRLPAGPALDPVAAKQALDPVQLELPQ